MKRPIEADQQREAELDVSGIRIIAVGERRGKDCVEWEDLHRGAKGDMILEGAAGQTWISVNFSAPDRNIVSCMHSHPRDDRAEARQEMANPIRRALLIAQTLETEYTRQSPDPDEILHTRG